VRLTLRLHRFELFAFGATIATLVVAAFAGAAYIDSLRPAPDWYDIAETLSPTCAEAFRRHYEAQQALGGLMPPLLVVTYAIGLFLGVPIVARELERGTVRLAWSLAPSRWRWYVARVVPILLVLVVLTFAAGVAADRLFAASTPGAPGAYLSSSFNGYGTRGGLLASRAVFIFAVSVVVGSFLGRALPAVIVAALVAAIGLFGGIQVHQKILQGEAVAIPIDQNGNGGTGTGPGQRRPVHRPEVRAPGRHPRRLQILQRLRSVRRDDRQLEVPHGRPRGSRRALPVRGDARSARVGRRLTRGLGSRRIGGVEEAPG
jgi:hypothetical protein